MEIFNITLNAMWYKVLYSVVAVGTLFALRHVLLYVLFKRIEGTSSRYYTQKWVSGISNILLVLIIAHIWTSAMESLATYLGLLSAGLAIALKDPITNLVGWAFILWRRPFELGDRVQVGSLRGDVVDIRLFQFTLLEIGNWVDAEQSTGRVVHIPNANVFIEPTYNYSKGFEYIWDELHVLVTFESDWRKAKSILSSILSGEQFNLSMRAQQQLREASKKFMIYYQNLSPRVYTTVKDCGVMLSMRFLCEPRKRRGMEELLWEQILTQFEEHHNIDLAYPTTRFYSLPEK